MLAAGRATRFGGDKLLAPLRGRPVLAHVLAALHEAGVPGVRVVLREGDAALAAVATGAGASLVPVAAGQGMGASVRAGLLALAAAVPPGPAAALVLLGDQPAVPAHAIAQLAERWRRTGTPLLRVRYAGHDEPGHPLLLDRALWPLAEDLAGDRGLEPLLRARGLEAALVDVAGANPDIDTRDDLDALSRLP